MTAYLCEKDEWSPDVWEVCCDKYLAGIQLDAADSVGARLYAKCEKIWRDKSSEDSWGADEDAELKTACDVEFSLARTPRVSASR